MKAAFQGKNARRFAKIGRIEQPAMRANGRFLATSYHKSISSDKIGLVAVLVAGDRSCLRNDSFDDEAI
jgi:hypothetical protein